MIFLVVLLLNWARPQREWFFLLEEQASGMVLLALTCSSKVDWNNIMGCGLCLTYFFSCMCGNIFSSCFKRKGVQMYSSYRHYLHIIMIIVILREYRRSMNLIKNYLAVVLVFLFGCLFSVFSLSDSCLKKKRQYSTFYKVWFTILFFFIFFV